MCVCQSIDLYLQRTGTISHRENFKTWILIFEKFYHKEINIEDPHFQLFILKSFEERSSKQ